MVDTADLNPLWKARLDKFMAAASQAGYPSSIISGYRSNEEQAGLYAKYKAGGNLAAPPGASMHNVGMAVDLSSKDIPGLDKFAAAHPEYGVYNNATADADHFQMFPWGTHAQDAANTVKGWNGVDPGPGTAVASGAPATAPGTTLNTTPAPAAPAAAPAPAAPQQNQLLAQGASMLKGALGGGNAPTIQPMQPPNLQVHQPQVDPSMLQAMTMQQQRRPYGLSLGGGPFDDSQGQGYA
jgi:hypothetical protein